MPLGVAVEEPDARVVGLKADGGAVVAVYDHGVAADGRGGGGVQAGPLRVLAAALEDLEVVAVETGLGVLEVFGRGGGGEGMVGLMGLERGGDKLEGMGAVIVIVDLELDDGGCCGWGGEGHDHGVDLAVDGGVIEHVCWCCEGCEHGWNLDM